MKAIFENKKRDIDENDFPSRQAASIYIRDYFEYIRLGSTHNKSTQPITQ